MKSAVEDHPVMNKVVDSMNTNHHSHAEGMTTE